LTSNVSAALSHESEKNNTVKESLEGTWWRKAKRL